MTIKERILELAYYPEQRMEVIEQLAELLEQISVWSRDQPTKEYIEDVVKELEGEDEL